MGALRDGEDMKNAWDRTVDLYAPGYVLPFISPGRSDYSTGGEETDGDSDESSTTD